MPRLDAITGLRWWAAFAVFVFHIRNLVTLPGPLEEAAQFGHLGVAFFFVLSGFVLTWSWRPEVDKRTFYWRRFARIYPLHLVTPLLAVPVFYSFAPDPAQTWVKAVDGVVLLLCVLLLQGWSRESTVLFAGNPASWTLTAEAFFYATHPFISRVLRRLTMIGALLAAVAVVVVAFGTRWYITVNPTGVVADLPWPILRLNEFVLGMCLAWAFRRGWLPRIPLVVPLGLLALWFGGILASARVDGLATLAAALGQYTNEVVTVLCALLIVTVASLELRGRTRVMRARPIVALGEWSYAFYLVHATVLYAVRGFLGTQGGGWNGLLWFTLVLAVSIALSWVLHVYVERPLESRMRRWQDDRRAARRPVEPAGR